MVDLYQQYTSISIKTAVELSVIAQSETIQTLSRLSLPEIETVVKLVAALVPAGNIPGLILSGLARLPGRVPPPETVKRDLDFLLKGAEQALDATVYATVFAGPAAVIWAYQNLLKLAGKDIEHAFPDGPWQFYVEYALREDSARHANETHGFDTFLNQHQLQLTPIDRITAWVMASIHCLHQYDALLTNEWRERVYTHLLAEVVKDKPEAVRYARLYPTWEKQRPYGCGSEMVTDEAYPAYRRRRFDEFLNEAIEALPPPDQVEWREKVGRAEAEELPAYLRQMSILAYLDPGRYGETRTPIILAQAHIGLIYRGSYYLIPACNPDTGQPAEVQTVRAKVKTILTAPTDHAFPLVPLAEIKRMTWHGLRETLRQTLVQELTRLRLAPILLNCEPRSPQLPLSELRQAERGLGDHALTLFDTGRTMVFDQSHIFFDGAWGAALAEIMTQGAIAWAEQLHKLEPSSWPVLSPLSPLRFERVGADLDILQQAPRVTPEVGVETETVDLSNILKLRRRFKERSEQIHLTINDLLILYRAFHALTYHPTPELVIELKRLASSETSRPAALAALEAINQRSNPAIAIPVDVSPHDPRHRLYPMIFEVPFDLEFTALHQRTLTALAAYDNNPENSEESYAQFDALRRTYLATLAGFGDLLNKGKALTRLGESTSIGALKLMAYLPAPLQQVLNKVPDQFEVLNDLLKGREVISNVGAVVPSSSLTRFISAKDDNDKKTLIWGVLTDAQGIMRITLRDFRPHVGLLMAAGQKDLARRIAQHYLESYASGFNHFIGDLRRINRTSRRNSSQKKTSDG